jgi:MoxR-like ATPase
MKLTKNWLTEKGACLDGRKYAEKNLIGLSEVEVVRNLIESKNLKWANWFIVRTMTYKQYVSYAVYAAEQVIDIYEKKHPDNKKPRLAIEAAKKCIDNPSDENKKAAAAAAADAYAYAAYAAADAAAAAAAAYAAAAYAADAAYAAAAAAAAADAYAYADADADDAAAAAATMRIKILEYGIKLLEETI